MTLSKGIDKNIIITGIFCLTVLEIFALRNGINGTVFTIVVAIIAGAIGVTIPTPKILNRGNK